MQMLLRCTFLVMDIEYLYTKAVDYHYNLRMLYINVAALHFQSYGHRIFLHSSSRLTLQFNAWIII